MERRIRMIALDIDGTLMTSGGKFHPENVRAIRRAQDEGVIVAIASGRSPGNVYLLLEEYGLKCPMMTVNGAQSVDENLNTFALHPMKNGTAVRVAGLLLSEDIPFFMMGEGFICTSGEAMRHHSELAYGDRLPELGHVFYHGPERLMEMAQTGKILKLFVPDTPRLEEIRVTLRAEHGIALTRSGRRNIEIMTKDIDKATGIRDMAAHYGIDLSSVMAVGDEENDLPMLEAAGLPVAMGNATGAVKERAAHITATNDEAGVARAIYELAL